MKLLMNIISKTLKGGIFFVIPIMVIYIVLGRAYAILSPIARKITSPIFPNSEEPAYGLAIVIIILICFLFGLVASSYGGKVIVNWLENNVFSMFPAYQVMKDTSENVLGMESTYQFPVVLAPIAGWMIAFLVDKLPDDEVLVFVPASPNFWEGNLVIFKKNEVRETKLSFKEAMQILRHTGIGTAELLQKKDSSESPIGINKSST